MDFLRGVVDLFLHLDKHLADIIGQYGGWTYAILFAVVFCETGLVVTPFLPGDSLLFAVGTFAGMGSLDVRVIVPLLLLATFLGDNVNYFIGKKIGRRAFSGELRFVKREYLTRTEAFYDRHGPRTVILARFVPIVRTFAPFVAGVGAMPYRRFIGYSLAGAVLWVGSLTLAGYFFGTIPVVRDNFSIVVLAIVAISIMPMVVQFARSRRATAA
jgi:membrane-associated protein